LIVGLLIGAAATYALAGSRLSRTTTVTSTSTMTVTTDSTQEVVSACAAHLKNFESKNQPAIAGDYENNATFSVTGNAVGLTGTYVGLFNIRILYGSMLSQRFFATVNLKNVSYAVNVLGNGKAAVKSNFTMYGNSTYISASHGAIPVMGSYVATVRSEVSYASVGNAWLISNETWNFLTLDFNG
jgi:hypothetical protein